MVLAAAALLVIACVITHLLSLRGIDWLQGHGILRHRLHEVRMGVMLFLALLVHLVEIAYFAVGFRLLAASREYGALKGEIESFRDYFYYSATTYTSVGFGDITPMGDLRGLTAIEALTGLVLITWTASFAFMTMQRWRGNRD